MSHCTFGWWRDWALIDTASPLPHLLLLHRTQGALLSNLNNLAFLLERKDLGSHGVLVR